jgi:hypothetical protein
MKVGALMLKRELMKYDVRKCTKGRRYFRDGKLMEIVEAAFFEDDEVGCPLAGNGKCGNFCTAFHFKIPKK